MTPVVRLTPSFFDLSAMRRFLAEPLEPIANETEVSARSFVNTKLVRVASTDAQTGPPTVRRETTLGRIRFRRGGPPIIHDSGP